MLYPGMQRKRAPKERERSNQEETMAVTQETMTNEQRKSVALEYLKRLDRGEDFFDLFADDIQVYFPKWGLANGQKEMKQLFTDLTSILKSIVHDYTYFNYIIQDDLVVVEGTSSGTTPDGVEWRAGVTHAGRWCDVFEIRDFKIQRLYIYLDPDYAGADTARYPWLNRR
jgi:ketosteroid isomerase-like protein